MAGKLLSAGGGGARQTTPPIPPSLDRRRKETKDFEQENRERERLGCCVKVVTIKLTLLQVNITKNVKTNNKVSNYFSK